VVVADAEAYHGSRWLLERAKVTAELAAGCTVAAARRLRREGRIPDDARLVLVICGGNVDLPTLCSYSAAFEAG
jgi:threonine dehydratase